MTDTQWRFPGTVREVSRRRCRSIYVSVSFSTANFRSCAQLFLFATTLVTHKSQKMCVATIHLTRAKSTSCGICWSYMTADLFLRRGNNYQMLHTPHAEKYSVRSFPWAFSPINKSLIFLFATLLSKSTLPRKKKTLPNLTLSAIYVCTFHSRVPILLLTSKKSNNKKTQK